MFVKENPDKTRNKQKNVVTFLILPKDIEIMRFKLVKQFSVFIKYNIRQKIKTYFEFEFLKN